MSWNVTNRLLDFSPSTESVVVNRLLINLHKQIDAHFPEADLPPRQFTKTVFSNDKPRFDAIPDVDEEEEPRRLSSQKQKLGKRSNGSSRGDDFDDAKPSRHSHHERSISSVPIPHKTSGAQELTKSRTSSALRPIIFVLLVAIIFLGILLLSRP